MNLIEMIRDWKETIVEVNKRLMITDPPISEWQKGYFAAKREMAQDMLKIYNESGLLSLVKIKLGNLLGILNHFHSYPGTVEIAIGVDLKERPDLHIVCDSETSIAASMMHFVLKQRTKEFLCAKCDQEFDDTSEFSIEQQLCIGCDNGENKGEEE